jgi:riboflavin kinase
LETLLIRGKIFSGKGEGAKFVGLPWVKKQIAEKLEFIPYPGTLNIKLAEKDARTKNRLSKAKGIEISSVEGFCNGKCFRAFLRESLKCIVVIPQVPNYPENVLEIIAPIHLRERLRLKDGDVVDIKVILE